jgi:DNA-binding beta-propeller fold protein YncE
VTGLVAVGLRDPDRVALVDGRTGTVVKEVALPESPRHLDLAAPGGPVLVPAERSNSLAQVSLPDGAVLSNTPVGRFPHNAAAGAGRVFVVNEFGSTMSVIEDGRVIETVPTPLQPGGVAVTPSGLVGVIGVRGLALQVYDAKTLRPVGLLDAGAGPTHVVADLENRFFVADTRGGAILVYATDPQPVMLARVPTPGGAPYGIAFDARRGHLWVTLTALNQVVEYAAQGGTLRQLAVYPTVRQANSVAVDPASGRVFVAGATDGTLQILDPEILRAA